MAALGLFTRPLPGSCKLDTPAPLPQLARPAHRIYQGETRQQLQADKLHLSPPTSSLRRLYTLHSA